jgi:hypothetical protein
MTTWIDLNTSLLGAINTIRSFYESSPLVQLALVLWLGLLAGELVRRWLNWPVVVGYMLAGILLGPYVLAVLGGSPVIATGVNLASADLRLPWAAVESSALTTNTHAPLHQLVDVCIGFVLFELGRRLDLGWLKLNPWILLLGVAEIVIVFAAVYGFLLVGGIQPIAAGLVAAVAIASSPAIIMAVARESGAEGQVTKRAMCLIALNCFVSFIVIHILLATTKQSEGLAPVLLEAAQQVGGAALLGGAVAAVLCWFARLIGKTQERQFVLLIAGLCAAAGLAFHFNVSLMITTLFIGIYARNIDAGNRLATVKMGFAVQLMLLVLFVYAGATMQFVPIASLWSEQSWTLLVLGAALLLTRALAKLIAVGLFGAWGGLDLRRAILIAAALLPMGELGLLMAASATKFASLIGPQLYASLLFVVALSQLLGPHMVRFALIRAGETKPVDPFHDAIKPLPYRMVLR